MTRLVKFDDDTSKYFEWMWKGLLLGALQGKDGGRRNRDSHRMKIERKLVKKLRTISTETEEGLQTGEKMRKILTGEQLVEFTQEELDTLTDYMGSVPWFVTATVDVFDAIDFLDASEKKL